MPGLDATVDEVSGVDLKWTNNTDTPVVIQAKTDGSNVSFALFGQKPGWQVKVDPAVVGQVVKTSGRTVTQYEPSMPAGKSVYVEEAQDGYTAMVRRTVTAAGQEPRVLTLVSTYQPSENIIAVGTGGRR
jgi:vancomycin resistance protein YoaR